MSLFGILDMSASALGVYKTWLDTVADNVANHHVARGYDDEAYHPKFIVAQAKAFGVSRERSFGGIRLAAIVDGGSPEGMLVHEPQNPLAINLDTERNRLGQLNGEKVQLTTELTGSPDAARTAEINARLAEMEPEIQTLTEYMTENAGKEGYVRYPDMDMSNQVTQMVMAQRAYQMNINTVTRAREAYRQALTIGQ